MPFLNHIMASLVVCHDSLDSLMISPSNFRLMSGSNPIKFLDYLLASSLVPGRPVSARLTSVAKATALAVSQFPSLAS